MDNDLLMVRGDPDVGYNLSIGEPEFIREYCRSFVPRYSGCPLAPDDYPALGGSQELIDEVRQSNPYVTGKKHIVIANGAKQALLATMYAYRTRSKDTKRVATLRAPYWPSFPTLLKFSDIKLVPGGNSVPGDQRINTSPNNPDGHIDLTDCEIWDASYAHPMYGMTGDGPKHEVSVWSIAKLFGLAGSRVGYLATDDDTIARKSAEYVEKTTSGVSNDSQHRIARLLRLLADQKDWWVTASNVLRSNGKVFNAYISPLCQKVLGVPSDGTGMFAFFKVVEDGRVRQALNDSGVQVIGGAACGIAEPGWYRMSLGRKYNYTKKALEALLAAYQAA